jgi:hypothetical protein
VADAELRQLLLLLLLVQLGLHHRRLRHCRRQLLVLLPPLPGG